MPPAPSSRRISYLPSRDPGASVAAGSPSTVTESPPLPDMWPFANNINRCAARRGAGRASVVGRREQRAVREGVPADGAVVGVAHPGPGQLAGHPQPPLAPHPPLLARDHLDPDAGVRAGQPVVVLVVQRGAGTGDG